MGVALEQCLATLVKTELRAGEPTDPGSRARTRLQSAALARPLECSGGHPCAGGGAGRRQPAGHGVLSPGRLGRPLLTEPPKVELDAKSSAEHAGMARHHRAG